MSSHRKANLGRTDIVAAPDDTALEALAGLQAEEERQAGAAPDPDNITQEDIDHLWWQLRRLEHLEYMVIIRRFGLEDREQLSLRATARDLGLGLSVVRRVERQALEHLRERWGVDAPAGAGALAMA